MRGCGRASLCSSALWLWLVVLPGAAAATGGSDMEQHAAAKLIRQSQALCEGEQQFVLQRKQVVLEALRVQGIRCTADSVPHVALLASGGGQRAAVALVGSLYQLQKEGLLDALLYLGGVSGSTWSMSSLYSDPQWSSGLDVAESRLMGPGVDLEVALAWLDQRSKEETFSLSDIWGVLTSAGIMKHMDLRRLSDETSRNASNPYPVYGAIEKHCFSNGPMEGKWFEVSPHEAGFTELGLFLETSLLGSKFLNGELLEQKPEMDMVQLQGVLGSALAHEDTLKDFIPPWLNVPTQLDAAAAAEYLRVYNALDKLMALTACTVKDPAALADLGRLQTTLADTVNHNESAWREAKSPEERRDLSQQWSLELLNTVHNWTQTLQDGPFRSHVSLLSEQVLPLVVKWEWGTTTNFLHQYQDAPIPPCLHSQETFHLVDAGLLINVGYPSFLGDKRDIDLIIAPEYSAGNMFETLTLARDYAAAVNKPFPQIDDRILEDREWPKDCYVLEGKDEAPTIVYMPLFNRKNSKDAEEFKAKMEEFSTFQRPFTQEKISAVLEVAKTNVRNNRETLLREMEKAAVRRQRRESAKEGRSQASESGLQSLV